MTLTLANFFTMFDVFAFLWGAIWGSFLNVVIYRLPEGLSLAHPPSRCPHCETRLAWYDNIPILGWMILRGRCRYCKAPIAIRYPLVELLTAVLSLALWVHVAHGRLVFDAMGDLPLLPVGMTFLLYFYFITILIAIAFIDWDRTIIPHELTGLGTVLGLIAAFALPHYGVFADLWPPVMWYDALIGLAVGGGFIWAIIKGYALIRGIEGMGWGDFTLMGMCGLWIGWQGVIVVLFLASIQGLIATFGYLAYSKVTGNSPSALIIEDLDAIDPWEGRSKEQKTSEGDAVLENPAPELQDAENETEMDEETPLGQLAVPFGPFIVIAALEYFFLGELFMPFIFPTP